MTEEQVRATLDTRPAGLLNKTLSREASVTFTGLFCGALKESTWILPGGHLFCGKAECEWHWPKAWDELRDQGLITYHIERKDAPGAKEGFTDYVRWDITEKGWDTREDDIAWFNELMAAMKDEREGRNL